MSKRLLLVLIAFSLVAASPGTFPTQESQGFRKGVTVAGIREHQAALQAIADTNGGSRVAGADGFDASAEYVHDKMVAAGYNVSYQEFEFLFVGDKTPPVLQRITAPAASYVDGIDFGTMSYSGSGDTTAPVTAVDLVLPPGPVPNTSTSGCEAADFSGFTAGHIALTQRGTCTFRTKTTNAFTAGASGIIIFNEGQPGRTAVIFGTLSPPPVSGPSVGTTFALGQALANGVTNGPTGITARLRTDTLAEVRTTRNVIAETPTGDSNHVVVVGAHLDSVTRGAGINDNGSGSATILEIAETYASQGRTPRNQLRFMWYGAEEFGLIGSTYYVNSLTQAERDRIELMLNFDMVGSPNFVRFVYDGDNSAFPVGPGVAAGPPGSALIEQVFVEYFDEMGLASAPTAFSGRSDYGRFIAVGIPAGGLFTGAEGAKTAAEAATYGGTAGQQYDPCYHLACDTYANVSLTGLDQMSDAAAHAVLLFSKRNFEQAPLVTP